MGAIKRVTGGNGIAANMALTIAGDTAPKLTRLRGLFTNRGTSDLGEVAMLLREEEGFDVRDGERLSELIRDASFGNVAVSMERHGRDMDADKERRHRDRIRAQAKKYGVKVVGVKFSVVEGRVLFIEQRRHEKAVELLSDRDKARFDAAVAQSEGIVSDDEIQAILNDVAERGITGRDAWQEALVLQRQLAEDARFKQEQGDIENAEDRATDEEPDWFKDFDDEADSKLGNEGTTAASDDFGLEQQTISDIDRQEAERVAAEKAKQADAAQEAADRAASEKQSLADKIKARAEDPDNFQFGEDSKAAAKPMGGLFDQPSPTRQDQFRQSLRKEGGSPSVAEQERSVYAVNEPDGITGDLFKGTENALPEATGKNLHGQRSAARRGGRAAPGTASRVLAVRQSPVSASRQQSVKGLRCARWRG